MKKQIICGLAAAVLTTSGGGTALGNAVEMNFEISASATQNLAFGDFRYVNSDTGVTITKYVGENNKVIIPDTIDGKPVTAIGDNAFNSCFDIKSVTIPNSVTSIGNDAFNSCWGLTSINIPNGVTSIGDYAFVDCALTSINLPDTVTSIGDYAFSSCSKLTSIDIPRSVSSFGKNVFAVFIDGSNLKSINVDPANRYYTSVDGVMYNKDMTELVAFPNGKTSVVLPDTVKSIDEAAFQYCRNLESAIIPGSVKSIGKEAFCQCSKLKTVTIRNGVKSIGKSAFESCEKLESVSIPNSVESIGDNAFYDCKAMTRAILPKSNISIGKYAVGYYYYENWDNPYADNSGNRLLRNFKIYCYEGTNGEQYAKDNKIACELIESATPVVTYTPGKGCVTLNWEAVAGAERYAVGIKINGRWTAIEKTYDTSYVLKGLKAGVKYNVAVIAMLNGEWYTNLKGAITVTPNEPVDNYPTVTGIEYSEQFHRFRLTWDAVEDATEYGVALKIAGKWKIQAYTDKTTYTSPKLKHGSIAEVVICAKIDDEWDTRNIDSRAFKIATSDKTVVDSGTCGKNVIWTLDDEGTLTFCGTGTIARSSYNNKNVKKVIIGDGITSIGGGAFSDCKNLSSINIPDSVKIIGSYAFTGCTSLKTVTIPETVTFIGYKTFGYMDDNYLYGEGIYGFNIRCYKGTASEEYAYDNGIPYTIIDDKVPDLTAVPGKYWATLNWKSVKNAEKYAIAVKVDGKWTLVEKTTDTTYTLYGLKADTNYNVAVIAMFNGEWYTNFSGAVTVKPNAPVYMYPKVTDIEYNEQFHQFRLTWNEAKGAEEYGIAVKIAGKWRIQAYTDKTTFTSPKLRPDSIAEMVICAKVDGKWDTSNINARAFSVTVK